MKRSTVLISMVSVLVLFTVHVGLSYHYHAILRNITQLEEQQWAIFEEIKTTISELENNKAIMQQVLLENMNKEKINYLKYLLVFVLLLKTFTPKYYVYAYGQLTIPNESRLHFIDFGR